jgi:transposase-like protein
MGKRRRFTTGFKAKVVPEVLAGTQPPSAACRKHGPSPNLLGLWTATFVERAHALLQPGEQRDLDLAGCPPRAGVAQRRCVPDHDAGSSPC